MVPKYYVYVWFRRNGIPCYVGKGHGDRWRRRKGVWRNKHLQAIYDQAGGDLPMVIVRDGLTELEAFETEIALIAKIGREINGGPLVNLTDGGDGPSGQVLSATARLLIGAASKSMWSDAEQRAKTIAAQNAGRGTPEYREKRSLISSEVANRPEFRDGNRAKAIERFADPVERQKTSEATRRGMAQPESKKNQSAGQKARFADPAELERMASARRGKKQSSETIAKRAAALVGSKRTPEQRAKMSAWQVGRKMSDEAKAKMSAKAKARWADPAERQKLADMARAGASARWKKTES